MNSTVAVPYRNAARAVPAEVTGRARNETGEDAMLTTLDIEQVRTAGMGSAIASTADRVAAVYRESSEHSGVRWIAEDIMGIWLKAAAQEVREALAQQLRHCPFLPKRLAVEMAKDIDSVAVPMLQFSEIFSDEDLCEIVRDAGVDKQLAVAAREEISYVVAEALVASENEDVVTALVRNDGAQLTQGLLHRIIDTYTDSQPVHEELVHRAALPVSIAERLITVVADHLRQHLVERFQMPSELADGLAVLSREAATSASLPPQAGAGVANLFVAHLDAAQRLTATFLLRTLCDGQVEIFKAGLARRASIAPDGVGEILRSGDQEQRSTLFLRAGIPSLLVPAFRAAVHVIINGADPGEAYIVSERQIRQVINRIVRQYEDIDPKDLESVLMRLSQTLCRRAGEGRSTPAAAAANALPTGRRARESVWGPSGLQKGQVRVGVGNNLIAAKPVTDGQPCH
jgi:uncharacterized protein (DUF2336 family)